MGDHQESDCGGLYGGVPLGCSESSMEARGYMIHPHGTSGPRQEATSQTAFAAFTARLAGASRGGIVSIVSRSPRPPDLCKKLLANRPEFAHLMVEANRRADHGGVVA